MINVRGEFSTAAKNATKKRHRRAGAFRLPRPLFQVLSPELFHASRARDRQRAFVRSFWFLWRGNQNIVQSQPSLQITPPRLTAERFMLTAWRRCAVERDRRARTLPNRARAGANFGHRCCRIWPTICYSDDKDRISYADADDFKEFESDFDRISRRSQCTFTQLRRSTQWRADRGGWRRQYSSISCLLWTNKTRRRLLWLRVKRKRHTERGGGGRRGNRETSHGHTT